MTKPRNYGKIVVVYSINIESQLLLTTLIIFCMKGISNITKKIRKLISLEELLFLSLLNSFITPIFWLNPFNFKLFENGDLQNNATLVLELSYGIQIAIIVAAYYFWKERKTEEKTEKANRIITMEEKKWKEFLDDNVKKYYQKVEEFLDKLRLGNLKKINESFDGADGVNKLFGIVINRNGDFSPQLSGELNRSLVTLRDICSSAYSHSVELYHPESPRSVKLMKELEEVLLEFRNKFFPNS